jgi:hypothetical protein
MKKPTTTPAVYAEFERLWGKFCRHYGIALDGQYAAELKDTAQEFFLMGWKAGKNG